MGMVMATDYEVDASFAVRDAGEEVELQNGLTFYAVVDRAERVDDEGDVIGHEWCLTWASSDRELANGDRVKVKGEWGKVREVMDDGYGWSECKLTEVA